MGRKFQKALCDGTGTPWLDENETLKKQIAENKWLRWDGTTGTAHEHMKWMLEQAKSLISEERQDEFREYGEKRGCKYFIHDELTKNGQGYGFFKLQGTLKLEPKDMVAACYDWDTLAESDKTVVLMKTLKIYQEEEGGPFCAAVYWCNAPGFPFYYRDGLDLSGYAKDEDGTLWQIAVTAKGNDFRSMPGALSATDTYWAYKLEPNGDGTTKTTLICQTLLNGYIPKFLSNYMICSVLIDYMTTTEETVKKNKASGKHQELLDRLGLEGL